MSKTVNIIVSGPAKTGKSRMIHSIIRALVTEHGLEHAASIAVPGGDSFTHTLVDEADGLTVVLQEELAR